MGQGETKHQRLWKVIEDVQRTIRASDSEMADLMALTASQFLKLRAAKKDVGIQSLMSLAQRIHVGLEKLVVGEIDYRAVAKQFDGQKNALPEKYVVGANSRRTTVINILDWISENLGWGIRARVLREFQVSERAFDDPTAEINLRLSVDIGDWILKRYRRPEWLVGMGTNASRNQMKKTIGSKLSKSKSLEELYERLFIEVVPQDMERNFFWKILNLNSQGILVKGSPNLDLMEDLGDSYVNSYSGSLIRQGVMASMSGYIGLTPIPVRQLKRDLNDSGELVFYSDFRPHKFFRPTIVSSRTL